MISNISTWSYNRENYPRMRHWWRNWSYRTTTSACRYDPTSGSDERNRMCPSTHRVSAEDVPIVRLVPCASRSSRSSLLIWLAKVGNWSCGAWVTRKYEHSWSQLDVQVSILLLRWLVNLSSESKVVSVSMRRKDRGSSRMAHIFAKYSARSKITTPRLLSGRVMTIE